MFHQHSRCPFCQQGLPGFFVRRSHEVVLVCDECDLAYPSPDKVNLDDSFEINDTQPFNDGHWASSQEIAEAGMSQFIAGEKRDARDGEGTSVN
jgi:hypothetical protein